MSHVVSLTHVPSLFHQAFEEKENGIDELKIQKDNEMRAKDSQQENMK